MAVLAGCVKTPIGMVTEWVAQELQGDGYDRMVVHSNNVYVIVTIRRKSRWVEGVIYERDLVGGPTDPVTIAALTRLWDDMKVKI